MPSPSNRHEWAQHGLEGTIGCPAWADDFLQPQTGCDSADLLVRVQLSTRLITERATSMGMTVSFGRDKTAVLIPSWVTLLSDGVSQHSTEAIATIPIFDRLTEQTHQLQVVQSYKHLGGILVATASPLTDLYHRFARANAVVKPLHRRLFGDPTIPITTRRALLRSLAVSRFVHTSAAIFLHAACHKRVWAQQFVALWRSLFKRTSETRTEHFYTVLRVAQAPSPPLALAHSRASFLAKITRSGPGLLARLLFDHWATSPSRSWLEQLRSDVHQVCLYLPHLRTLLPAGREVPAILDSLLEDPVWWLGQVKQAIRRFAKDLEVWHRRKQEGTVEPQPDVQVERPFVCGYCKERFVLRKHLGVHLARTHAVLAPARHFAPVPYCLACHRHYGKTCRVQQHLKSSDKCLLRMVHLIRPLSSDEIKEVEMPDTLARKRQRAGLWKEYEVPTARPLVFGPRIPTWTERCPPSDADEGSVLVSELVSSFRPTPTDVAWIEDHLGQRSCEGPRPTASSFWDNRPVSPFA